MTNESLEKGEVLAVAIRKRKQQFDDLQGMCFFDNKNWTIIVEADVEEKGEFWRNEVKVVLPEAERQKATKMVEELLFKYVSKDLTELEAKFAAL